MDQRSSMVGIQPDDRVVYHRGHVVYAVSKSDGAYRHVLDVPNGDGCGCLCDTCSASLVAKANLPEEVYLRACHFAHEAGSACDAKGDRGLLEAVKSSLLSKKSILLPAVVLKMRGSRKLVTVRGSKEVAIDGVESCGVQGRTVPDLRILTPSGPVRLRVSTSSRVDREYELICKRDGISTVQLVLLPDEDGRIFLSELNAELTAMKASRWLYHSEIDTLQADWEKRRSEIEEPLIDIVAKPRAARKTEGTFWCLACRQNVQFIPELPGSPWCKCGGCGALSCPTVIS